MEANCTVYSVQRHQGAALGRERPRLIFVRDDKPDTWYRDVGSMRMLGTFENYDLIKDYGRVFHSREMFDRNFPEEAWKAVDAIKKQFEKDNRPKPWNGKILDGGRRQRWGYISPEGIFYPCLSHEHITLAIRLAAVFDLDCRYWDCIEKDLGWLHVSVGGISSRQDPTIEQATTLEKMYEVFEHEGFKRTIREALGIWDVGPLVTPRRRK
ncbi:hypothetical protein KAR91_09745 [Candidatus Pacearchaeota archaeon]|nr:hypothetical protein [Candidatus Pacearchaeota archaeon]